MLAPPSIGGESKSLFVANIYVTGFTSAAFSAPSYPFHSKDVIFSISISLSLSVLLEPSLWPICLMAGIFVVPISVCHSSY